MVTAADRLSIGRSNQREVPITVETYPQQSCDVSNNDQPMTKAAEDEQLRQLLILFLSKNEKGWTQWLPPIMMAGMLVVGGVRMFSSTESTLRQEVIQAQSEAKSARAEAEKAHALIDKLETYNQNTREQFAAHGWLIDPVAGKITKARGR